MAGNGRGTPGPRRRAAGTVVGPARISPAWAAAGYQPALRRPAAPRTADGVPLAGWWWRVLATVIDGIILSALGAIVLAPIYLRLVRAMSDAFSAIVRAAQAGQPRRSSTPPISCPPATSWRSRPSLALQMIYLVTFLRWKPRLPESSSAASGSSPSMLARAHHCLGPSSFSGRRSGYCRVRLACSGSSR